MLWSVYFADFVSDVPDAFIKPVSSECPGDDERVGLDSHEGGAADDEGTTHEEAHVKVRPGPPTPTENEIRRLEKRHTVYALML